MSSHVEVEIPNGRGDYFGDGTECCPVCSADRFHGATKAQSNARQLSREQSLRMAVLSLFCHPVPEQCSILVELSAQEWKRMVRWLDLSGLALYFLDRLVELRLCNLLPTAVFTRLHLSLIDNTERTRQMLLESMRIQKGFQQSRISYAVLKGISLWPAAVARPELRSQFDMDYLVAESDLATAQGILERAGYRLYAVSGKSWEFKKNEQPGVALKDIYKHFGSYGVELHTIPAGTNSNSLLDRLHWREVEGMLMPLLSPLDLFLGHGMHTFKHVRGEYVRAAQFLELRRHVIRYRDDGEFWRELRLEAEENRRTCLGMGLSLYLIEHVMGSFVPDALACWTVDRLPDRLRLWVHTYGHRVVLGDHPGTKLYLLLEQELEKCGLEIKRSARSRLLPAHLPPPAIRPSANESTRTRIRRNFMHLGTIVERARFHVVEGMRYAVEARRWHRLERLPR